MPEKIINIRVQMQTQNLSAGITKTNAELSSLEKTVGRISRSFVSFMAIMAAREIMQGLGNMVKLSGDLQYQMVLLGRATGMTSGELSGLKEDFFNLSTSMGIPIEQLAQLGINAGRAGVDTKEGMLEIAKAASMMASITDMSADQVATSLIKISNAMKLPFKDVSKLGSLIVSVSKKSAATEKEIIDAVLKMTASGGTLGFTIDQMVALASISIEVGNAASRAGTQWARAMTQLSVNSEKAAKIVGVTSTEFRKMVSEDANAAMTLLFSKLAEIPDRAKRLEEINKIFTGIGLRAVGPLIAQLDKFEERLEFASNELKRGDTLTKDYQATTNTFNKAIARLNATFAELAVTIGTDTLNPFTKLADLLSNIIKHLNTELKKEDNLFGFLTSQHGLGNIVGGMAQDFFMGKVAKSVGDATKEQPAIDQTVTLPPQVELPGITILSDQFSLLDELFLKFQEIVNGIKGIWTEMTGVLSTAWADATEQIKTKFSELGNLSQVIANNLVIVWDSVWKGIETSLSTAIQSMILKGENFKDIMIGFWESVKTTFVKAIADMIANLVIWAIQNAIINGTIVKTAILAAKAVELAWAGAAALVSLATFGGNAGPAMLGIAATKAFAAGAAGFAEGGWVGGIGNKDTVPALLTPGEYVLNKDQARAMTNNYSPNIVVNFNGGLFTGDPVQLQKFYREGLRDVIRNDIRAGRDKFYG